MTCREFIDVLSDYLSQELPAQQRATFEAHLRECPDCVAYLKSYEDTVKLGQRAFKHSEEAVPDDVPEELVRAIVAARREGS